MPRAQVIDVLIAAAHASELEGLAQAFGSAHTLRVRRLRVRRAEVGVGLLAAAVGTARLLQRQRPRALILLGSCGIYRDAARTPLLTAAIPSALQLMDAATSAGQAAYPEPMPIRAQTHPGLSAALARFGQRPVRGGLLTTPGITTSDALAKRLARTSGCVVENLEALAVALACQAERVPFSALLSITNVVGRRGRADWAAHRRAAAVRGADHLLAWLARGAPGLPPRRG